MKIFLEKVPNLVNQLVGCKKKIENELLVELVLNVFLKSYKHYIQGAMAQNSLPTLEQPTSKLLHEKSRRKLNVKKEKWKSFVGKVLEFQKKIINALKECNFIHPIAPWLKRRHSQIVMRSNLDTRQNIALFHMRKFWINVNPSFIFLFTFWSYDLATIKF